MSSPAVIYAPLRPLLNPTGTEVLWRVPKVASQTISRHLILRQGWTDHPNTADVAAAPLHHIVTRDPLARYISAVHQMWRTKPGLPDWSPELAWIADEPVEWPVYLERVADAALIHGIPWTAAGNRHFCHQHTATRAVPADADLDVWPLEDGIDELLHTDDADHRNQSPAGYAAAAYATLPLDLIRNYYDRTPTR